MAWDLDEAIAYYRSQGAPRDQNALIGLLKEIRQENGGGISWAAVVQIAQAYGIKEGIVLALIKRIPILRLDGSHLLELCSGRNCGKHRELAAYAEELNKSGEKFTLKFVPCMRMCGKGPNIRWDGKIYSGGTKELIRKLTDEA